ncbi:MAG TPA: hypothetical protein VNB94_12355 [Mycobacteriales bacterium]|nr:hypothetical protein [Mycobacteriales bacterium]
MRLLAHGLGGRSDLPIPFWLALYGAGITVVLSFAALGLLWPRPRLRGAAAGRPLPPWLSTFLQSRALLAVARVVVLAITLVVVAVAAAGPERVVNNLAPYVVYIVFWAGLVVVSLLVGPVWRHVNPLRTLHGALSRVGAHDPAVGSAALPDSVGYWPAAAGLAVFVWLELVPPWRAEPLTVLVFLITYGLVHLVAAQRYGASWFERAEAFEVYFTMVGRLNPIGRREDGVLVVRNPLNGIAALPEGAGLVTVMAVLLGSTGFDGLTRTRLWKDSVDADSIVLGTLGLLGTIVVVLVTFTAAAQASGRLGGVDPATAPGRFAHSVVPIAVGYAVAHYFSLAILDGQQALVLASDPFGRGADLFGTASWGINYDLVSTGAIALIQVGAIVVGHVIGVVSAHDRAVGTVPARLAGRSQLPLLLVMVGYTVGGVALLTGA